MAGQLTMHQISWMRGIFELLDKDGNGVLSRTELRDALKSVNPNITEGDLQRLIDEVDIDRDGKIDFPEFLKLLHPIMNARQIEADMKAAFDFFDKDRNGFIDVGELRQALTQLTKRELTDEDMEDIMRETDKDGDGKVSYEDFVKVIYSDEE